ncbi:hypothetical protein ACIQBJ_00935 [Kitasatospora sp. NPDC088391]|uniref:hypothetical protein n=1 Tax=Kitasatospora sp. NPDC088391 TaxID=3364074 RepID=UPI00380650D0
MRPISALPRPGTDIAPMQLPVRSAVTVPEAMPPVFSILKTVLVAIAVLLLRGGRRARSGDSGRES